MKKVNLYVSEVIKYTDKQEQGLVLAMRACKNTVYMHLRGSGAVYDSIEELERSYNAKHGAGFADEVREIVAEQCMKYPNQYEAANRWLTSRLIEVWKGEAMTDYYERTKVK